MSSPGPSMPTLPARSVRLKAMFENVPQGLPKLEYRSIFWEKEYMEPQAITVMSPLLSKWSPLASFLYEFVSSEGALIAITPYDYPQGRPLFEHTPVLDNNLNIIAMMTLVTIISMINKITKITRNIK